MEKEARDWQAPWKGKQRLAVLGHAHKAHSSLDHRESWKESFLTTTNSISQHIRIPLLLFTQNYSPEQEQTGPNQTGFYSLPRMAGKHSLAPADRDRLSKGSVELPSSLEGIPAELRPDHNGQG